MVYEINFRRLSGSAVAPYKKHDDDGGFDLTVSSVDFFEGGIFCGCGLAFDFSPVGFAFTMPRSSIWKNRLIHSNSVGLIDAQYRGEVRSVFYCLDDNSIPYAIGDRFIQLVFPTLGIGDSVKFVEVDSFEETERGSGGFGSTGK